MIRILHVVHSLKKNGTETFIMNVLRNIDRNMVMFDFLISTDKKDGYYDEIKSLGSKIYHLPSRKEGFFKYHQALNRFFKEHANSYDAIHMHVMSATTLAPLYYAKKYKIKKRILHFHGSNCRGLHNIILHYFNNIRIAKLATHYLGCSQQALKWGFKFPSTLKKGKYIINGIDIERFKFNNDVRKKYREQLNLGNDLTLINVGSFNPIKNHKFLLQVFKSLLKRNINSKLICIGTGELLEEMKEYSKKLEIDDKVLFLGRKENPAPYLNAADIMVMPSLHEGLGIVLIEAQVSNLPVIVSTGIPEETRLSDSYIKMQLQERPDSWAEIILNSDLYNQRYRTNPKIINFSVSRTVNQLYEIYCS